MPSKKRSQTLSSIGRCLIHPELSTNMTVINVIRRFKGELDLDKMKIFLDIQIGNTLMALFRRPLFQRKWVIQEAVISRNPIVTCSDESAL